MMRCVNAPAPGGWSMGRGRKATTSISSPCWSARTARSLWANINCLPDGKSKGEGRVAILCRTCPPKGTTGLLAVWERHEKEEGKIETLADVGSYLHMIKEAEPRFTGRGAIRRTLPTRSKMRAMDVELPDDWFATPEAVMHKAYDEKKAMIETLRGPITLDMVMREINRFCTEQRVQVYRQVRRCGGDTASSAANVNGRRRSARSRR